MEYITKTFCMDGEQGRRARQFFRELDEDLIQTFRDFLPPIDIHNKEVFSDAFVFDGTTPPTELFQDRFSMGGELGEQTRNVMHKLGQAGGGFDDSSCRLEWAENHKAIDVPGRSLTDGALVDLPQEVYFERLKEIVRGTRRYWGESPEIVFEPMISPAYEDIWRPLDGSMFGDGSSEE